MDRIPKQDECPSVGERSKRKYSDDMMEPSSQHLSNTGGTPPRKIVLGIVDAANIKCTNLNRKRRWDQGPEQAPSPEKQSPKKHCPDTQQQEQRVPNHCEPVSEPFNEYESKSCNIDEIKDSSQIMEIIHTDTPYSESLNRTSRPDKECEVIIAERYKKSGTILLVPDYGSESDSDSESRRIAESYADSKNRDEPPQQEVASSKDLIFDNRITSEDAQSADSDTRPSETPWDGSDKNGLVIEETIFIEGIKPVESRPDDVNIKKEKDVLLSDNPKTESSDSWDGGGTTSDPNKEADNSNDGSLAEAVNVNSKETSSDQEELDEAEILGQNSINVSSADNVDPAVMEIIFGIGNKPLTVSNTDEAYPALKSPTVAVEITEVQKNDEESRETNDDTVECIDIEHAKRVVLGDEETVFGFENDKREDLSLETHGFPLESTEVVTVDPNKPLMSEEQVEEGVRQDDRTNNADTENPTTETAPDETTREETTSVDAVEDVSIIEKEDVEIEDTESTVHAVPEHKPPAGEAEGARDSEEMEQDVDRPKEQNTEPDNSPPEESTKMDEVSVEDVERHQSPPDDTSQTVPTQKEENFREADIVEGETCVESSSVEVKHTDNDDELNAEHLEIQTDVTHSDRRLIESEPNNPEVESSECRKGTDPDIEGGDADANKTESLVPEEHPAIQEMQLDDNEKLEDEIEEVDLEVAADSSILSDAEGDVVLDKAENADIRMEESESEDRISCSIALDTEILEDNEKFVAPIDEEAEEALLKDAEEEKSDDGRISRTEEKEIVEEGMEQDDNTITEDSAKDTGIVVEEVENTVEETVESPVEESSDVGCARRESRSGEIGSTTFEYNSTDFLALEPEISPVEQPVCTEEQTEQARAEDHVTSTQEDALEEDSNRSKTSESPPPGESVQVLEPEKLAPDDQGGISNDASDKEEGSRAEIINEEISDSAQDDKNEMESESVNSEPEHIPDTVESVEEPALEPASVCSPTTVIDTQNVGDTIMPSAEESIMETDTVGPEQQEIPVGTSGLTEDDMVTCSQSEREQEGVCLELEEPTSRTSDSGEAVSSADIVPEPEEIIREHEDFTGEISSAQDFIKKSGIICAEPEPEPEQIPDRTCEDTVPDTILTDPEDAIDTTVPEPESVSMVPEDNPPVTSDNTEDIISLESVPEYKNNGRVLEFVSVGSPQKSEEESVSADGVPRVDMMDHILAATSENTRDVTDSETVCAVIEDIPDGNSNNTQDNLSAESLPEQGNMLAEVEDPLGGLDMNEHEVEETRENIIETENNSTQFSSIGLENICDDNISLTAGDMMETVSMDDDSSENRDVTSSIEHEGVTLAQDTARVEQRSTDERICMELENICSPSAMDTDTMCAVADDSSCAMDELELKHEKSEMILQDNVFSGLGIRDDNILNDLDRDDSLPGSQHEEVVSLKEELEMVNRLGCSDVMVKTELVTSVVDGDDIYIGNDSQPETVVEPQELKQEQLETDLKDVSESENNSVQEEKTLKSEPDEVDRIVADEDDIGNICADVAAKRPDSRESKSDNLEEETCRIDEMPEEDILLKNEIKEESRESGSENLEEETCSIVEMPEEDILLKSEIKEESREAEHQSQVIVTNLEEQEQLTEQIVSLEKQSSTETSVRESSEEWGKTATVPENKKNFKGKSKYSEWMNDSELDDLELEMDCVAEEEDSLDYNKSCLKEDNEPERTENKAKEKAETKDVETMESDQEESTGFEDANQTSDFDDAIELDEDSNNCEDVSPTVKTTENTLEKKLTVLTDDIPKSPDSIIFEGMFEGAATTDEQNQKQNDKERPLESKKDLPVPEDKLNLKSEDVPSLDEVKSDPDERVVTPFKIKLSSSQAVKPRPNKTPEDSTGAMKRLEAILSATVKEINAEPKTEPMDVPLLTTVSNVLPSEAPPMSRLNSSSGLVNSSSDVRKPGEIPKLEPITLRIYKDNLTVRTEGLSDSPKKSRSPKLNSSELKSQLSPHLKNPSSPGSKQLEFTLKIAKDSTTNYPKATMSPKSGIPSPVGGGGGGGGGPGAWKSSDFSRVEKILKESNVSITPIVPAPSSAPAPASPGDPKMNKITLKLPKDGGHPEIKLKSGEVVLSRSPNAELTIIRRERTPPDGSSPPEKKQKLDFGRNSTDAFQKPSDEVEIIKIVDSPTPKKLMESPMNTQTPVQKKRGRPRKVILPTPPSMMNTVAPNLQAPEELEASPLFPVPLFDLTEGGDINDPLHPSNRPMRSCRGRTKPIVVRTRRPRGGGFTRGGGRGRGIKRQLAADMESLSAYELAELAKIEARREKLKADRLAKKEAKQAKVLAKKLKDEERRKRVAREKAEAQALQVFEEETRMSAPDSSRAHTPAPGRINLAGNASNELVGDIKEESQGSISNTPTTTHNKRGRMEIPIDFECKEVRVDQLAEYQWQGSELFMIQEQISLYLGVKSFKRKYPHVKRRSVEAEERTFLEESGLVPKSMCDLGLTAVSSAEICDIMFHDFPDKYEEFRKHVREKQAREAAYKQKALSNSFKRDDRFKVASREQAIESTAVWNANLNKERKEERRCALDLQTFNVHYPKSRHSSMTRTVIPVGHYPVTLLPGQYCDYYKEYTSAELMYYPLNTVLYGPMRPNERQNTGGPSEASQSESDRSSSSSDDSSDCSSEGSGDEGGGNNDQEDRSKCKSCSGSSKANKEGQPEVLIQCAQCSNTVHPTCQDLTVEMVPHIKKYNWQCTDCKTCIRCKDPANEDKMLFCDLCDRGYHIYCVGLHKVPDGRWHCTECSVCSSCGTRDPGGPDWQHEYKKGDKGTKTYLRTLCVACSRLWKKGKFCQLCLKCHSLKPEEEAGLQQCNTCDRWIHKECYNARIGAAANKLANNGFQCDVCQERVQNAINSSNNSAATGSQPVVDERVITASGSTLPPACSPATTNNRPFIKV